MNGYKRVATPEGTHRDDPRWSRCKTSATIQDYKSIWNNLLGIMQGRASNQWRDQKR